MMKRKMWMIWMMVLTMAAMGMSAQAINLQFSDEPFAETAVQVKDGLPHDLAAWNFHLLGTDADGDYLIFADSQFLKLDADALSGILNALGDAADALPSVANYQTLVRTMKGEDVTRLQENMIALGFFDGEANGSFNRSSERAVSTFQKNMGLEETGEADPMLQMLMDSLRTEPATISAAFAAADAFAAISGKTDANLDDAIDLGLTLKYDDLAGVGFITKGKPVSYAASASSDLERRTFALQFGMRAEEKGGVVSVVPVLELKCTGIQRSVMRECIVKSGDERYTFAVDALDTGVSGLMTVESGRVMLNDEAVELLANAADVGELKLRVSCKYGEYDIAFTGDDLKNAALVGQAALRLND